MNRPDASALDWLLPALADSRRRLLLAYLLDVDDGAATFDDLVEVIAQAETDSPGPDRESIAINLHHHHLAHLAQMDLIEYERDLGVVQTTDTTGQVEPLFDLIPELDPRQMKD